MEALTSDIFVVTLEVRKGRVAEKGLSDFGDAPDDHVLGSLQWHPVYLPHR